MFKRRKVPQPRKRPNTPRPKGGRFRVRGRRYQQTNSLASMIPNFAIITRVIRSMLPNEAVKGIFDFFCNFIAQTINSQNLITGAYGEFELTPATFLRNSPLLAESDGGFSFPSYPVAMKFMNIVIRNTASLANRAGRWAAVLVPYKEEHDKKNIKAQMVKMKFEEIATMPRSRVGKASQDLILSYRMKNVIEYCSRPREITEAIGLIFVIWEESRDTYTSDLKASQFNCEIELKGGCQPNAIFGPSHRKKYLKTDFDVQSITKGEVRVHLEDGSVLFQPYAEFAHEQRIRRNSSPSNSEMSFIE